jgi:outer membrane receptor protein involved in Fe transport
LPELSARGAQFQRHTLNAYGTYRFNQAIDLSALYRYGSNFPLPGFYQKNGNGNGLVMASERKRIRLPAYSRLDVRLDKAFYLKRRKLTLYAEVNNFLNRSNRGCRVSPMLRLVPSCDSGFPILPAAGLKIEF